MECGALQGSRSPYRPMTGGTVLEQADGHGPTVCAWSNQDLNIAPNQQLIIVHLVIRWHSGGTNNLACSALEETSLPTQQ